MFMHLSPVMKAYAFVLLSLLTEIDWRSPRDMPQLPFPNSEIFLDLLIDGGIVSTISFVKKFPVNVDRHLSGSNLEFDYYSLLGREFKRDGYYEMK